MDERERNTGNRESEAAVTEARESELSETAAREDKGMDLKSGRELKEDKKVTDVMRQVKEIDY